MTLFFGILPIKVPKFRSNAKLLSFSNCFAGGLFLAIGLIHVLPEAIESLDSGKDHDSDHDSDHGDSFPWAYFISICSFSFILLIDKVIFNSADQVQNADNIDLSVSLLGKERGTKEENFQAIVSH